MKTPFTTEALIRNPATGKQNTISCETYTLDEHQVQHLKLDPNQEYAMLVPHVFVCGAMDIQVGVLVVERNGGKPVMELSSEQYFYMHIECAKAHGMPVEHLTDFRYTSHAEAVSEEEFKAILLEDPASDAAEAELLLQDLSQSMTMPKRMLH